MIRDGIPWQDQGSSKEDVVLGLCKVRVSGFIFQSFVSSHGWRRLLVQASCF